MTTALIGFGCGVFGYVAGRAHAGEPEPAAVELQPSKADPRASRKVRDLVCAARRRPETDSGAEGCEAMELRARWCEAELARARGERAEVRQEWPDPDSVESPEQWPDAVESALAECEIGAELELVDCTEYPCSAALRPAAPPTDPSAFEAEMKRLMGAARGCKPLQDALGVADHQLEQSIDVFRLDANCSEQREDFFVLMALEPEGPAYKLFHNHDRTDAQERDFNRWLYRRADDLSAMWPCE